MDGITERRFKFPTRVRLRKPAEYKKVFAEAFRQTDQCFTLLVVRNEMGYARLGFAVAKKSVRRAVARNKIKRLAREGFRQHQALLGGLDIVILARKDAAQAPAETLRHSLEKHWQKLLRRCAPSS